MGEHADFEVHGVVWNKSMNSRKMVGWRWALRSVRGAIYCLMCTCLVSGVYGDSLFSSSFELKILRYIGP